jgi:hypothetical protein
LAIFHFSAVLPKEKLLEKASKPKKETFSLKEEKKIINQSNFVLHFQHFVLIKIVLNCMQNLQKKNFLCKRKINSKKKQFQKVLQTKQSR